MFLGEGWLASQWGWGVCKFGSLAERHATSLVRPSDSVSPTHRLIPGVGTAIMIKRATNTTDYSKYVGTSTWQV